MVIPIRKRGASRTTVRRTIPNRGLLCCVLALGLAACGQDLPTLPFNPDPLVYLALSPAPDPSRPMHALLATMGTPVHSEYRDAELFEMKRASDGAMFAWRTLPVSGTVPISFLGTLADSIPANFVLDDEHDPGLLGRGDIVPGKTYTLDITTDGVTIHGETTVPAQVVPAIDTAAGDTVVHWGAAAGAAGYEVTGSVPAGIGVSEIFAITTDTIVTIHAPFILGGATVPPDAVETIRVVALDANLFRYVSDQTVTRAGIDAGFGAFGSFTEALLTRPIAADPAPERIGTR
ncbi:MAG TPA: hypothetical protein VFK13_11865 [Gemmatimonadaceae bacterium]|nr:hypothetical protein [Gemmatimonadaceae bacterium]